uniref:Mucin-1 n=1 Tax=Gopherus evgoodei TaxID=1825980 RepID=A0A8C4WE93_9SAUR
MTTPPPTNTTTPPPSNTTTPPPSNTTTPPPTKTITPPPPTTITPPPSNTTTLPPSTSTTTRARIYFFLSFRIVNWNFNDSLLNPSTSYYKELYSKIHFMVSTAAPPSPPCQRGRLPAPGWGASQGAPASCHVTSLRASGAPLVPGWGIALLVLVCILLVLSILIFILLIVCSCHRRSRGKLDLFSSQASYQPMNEYPTYHTHGRFSAPGKKQNPYSDVSSGTVTMGLPAWDSRIWNL